MNHPMKDLFSKEPIKTIHEINCCCMMSQLSLGQEQIDLPVSEDTQMSFSEILYGQTVNKRIQRHTFQPKTNQFNCKCQRPKSKQMVQTKKQLHSLDISGKYQPNHVNIPIWNSPKKKIYGRGLDYEDDDDEVNLMNSNHGQIKCERSQINMQTKKNFESRLTEVGDIAHTDSQIYVEDDPIQLTEKQKMQERKKIAISKFRQSDIGLDEVAETSQESNQTTVITENKKKTEDQNFIYLGGKMLESKKSPSPRNSEEFLQMSSKMMRTKERLDTKQTQEDEFIRNNQQMLRTIPRNKL